MDKRKTTNEARLPHAGVMSQFTSERRQEFKEQDVPIALKRKEYNQIFS